MAQFFSMPVSNPQCSGQSKPCTPPGQGSMPIRRRTRVEA
jgi:hypothetical protein